jgi:hypothetical protein
VNRLRTPFRRLGEAVGSRPVLTLAVAVVLLGAAAGGAAQITTVSGTAAFVQQSPALDTYQETFDRGVVAVVVGGDVTDPETMRAIDRFDRRASQAEHVRYVQTPADRVRAAYGRIPGSSRDIEAVVGSPERSLSYVVLESGTTQPEEAAVYEDAVEARAWARFPAGASVTVTGNPAFIAQLTDVIQQSTRQLLALAVGLMVVALFLLFRGVRLRLLPIVAVFVGVLYTLGGMGYLNIANSTLTSAIFPILIGLGIDYSVQFHQRFEEELQTAPPREALPEALAGIGPAVLVAMFAAVLGFAATWLMTRDIPAFVWFAHASMLGIALSFLAALVVLLPAFTLYARWRNGDAGGAESATADAGAALARQSGSESRSEPDPDGDSDRIGRLLGCTSRNVARHPASVVAVAGLLMVSGFYVSEDLDTLVDTEEFVPDDLPALLDLQQFRDSSGGGAAVQYHVLVSGQDLRDPETLRWMETFRDAARGVESVRSVDSPAAAVRQFNRGRLPETSGGVDRVLSRMPPEVRSQYFDEGHAHIVVVTERGMTPDRSVSFIENTRDAIEVSRPPPGVQARLTGENVVATPKVQEKVDQRNRITGLGVAFVFGLLVVYYRHPVKATAPLVPMLFVVGWQNLYMAAFDVAVSPLGASLGALTVGIGAEYTIVVMERYYEEKARGATPLDAVETASRRVGKAITVSGMTTVFGFSALILSPFPVLSDFGWLTVGVIFLTLVAAILTLPPTLVVLDDLWDAVRARSGATG